MYNTFGLLRNIVSSFEDDGDMGQLCKEYAILAMSKHKEMRAGFDGMPSQAIVYISGK
jgi:hypothetical protein